MSSFLAGQPVGRLLASYLIVWLVCPGVAGAVGRAVLQGCRVGLAVALGASRPIPWWLRPFSRVGVAVAVGPSGT